MIRVDRNCNRDAVLQRCYNQRAGCITLHARRGPGVGGFPSTSWGLFIWREDTASTTLRQRPSGIQVVGASRGKREREFVSVGTDQSLFQRNSRPQRVPGSFTDCYWWHNSLFSPLNSSSCCICTGAGTQIVVVSRRRNDAY